MSAVSSHDRDVHGAMLEVFVMSLEDVISPPTQKTTKGRGQGTVGGGMRENRKIWCVDCELGTTAEKDL